MVELYLSRAVLKATRTVSSRHVYQAIPRTQINSLGTYFLHKHHCDLVSVPVVYPCACQLCWLEDSLWICQIQTECWQARDSPDLMALALRDLVVPREVPSQQQSLDMLIRSDKYRFAWEHAGKKCRGRSGHIGPSLSFRALGKKEQRSFQLSAMSGRRVKTKVVWRELGEEWKAVQG